MAGTYASSSSTSITLTWMSMIGFAPRPATDVDPTCSIRTAASPSASDSRFLHTWNECAHSSLYATSSTGSATGRPEAAVNSMPGYWTERTSRVNLARSSAASCSGRTPRRAASNAYRSMSVARRPSRSCNRCHSCCGSPKFVGSRPTSSRRSARERSSGDALTTRRILAKESTDHQRSASA